MDIKIKADDMQNIKGILNITNDDMNKQVKVEVKQRIYNYKG